uniref:Uncharacterized protein n=1 Tax=Nomascus leucogenys TaxID=61853 RepID=A0A2I3HEI7_NOMLE
YVGGCSHSRWWGGCLGGSKSSRGVTELANRLVCLVFLLHVDIILLILLPGPPQGYRKVKSSPELILSSLLTEGTAGYTVPPGLVLTAGRKVRELANGKFIRVALAEKEWNAHTVTNRTGLRA